MMLHMLFNDGDGTTSSSSAKDLSWGSVYKNLTEAIESNTSKLQDELAKIDKVSMGLVKNFGLGKDAVLNFRQSIFEVREGLAELNMTQEDGYKMLQESATAIGRNTILSKEGQLDLAAAMKVTGKSAKDIVGPLADVGVSANLAGKEMEKIVNSSRQIGVNASLTTEMVLKNIDKLNVYNFQGGVEGLSKMAAQSVALRINMGDVLKTADKAFNPEGAIQMAAELQRLGVTQSALLDPLNLMNMAENDPAELQNQIANMSKDFVRLKKDGTFEIMPGAKRRMMEIEKSLGMTTGSLSKMALASAEMDDKMKKISFGSGFSEEEKKLIANMSQMGEGGEYKMKIDGQDLNMNEAMEKIRGMSEEERKKFFESQQPKSMEDLAKEQLTALERINASLLEMQGKTASAMMATDSNLGQKYIDAQANAMIKSYQFISEQVIGDADTLKSNFETNADILRDINDMNSRVVTNVDESMALILKGMELNISVGTMVATNMELLENFYAGRSGGSIFGGGNTTLQVLQGFTAMSEDISSIAKKLGITKTVNDLIISDNGTFETLEKDSILAGTGLNVISDMLKNPINPETMAKMMSPQVVSNESKAMPDKIGIDLNINVTAPSQIDTNQIVTTLKDQFVIEQLIGTIKQVMTNNNLTPIGVA